MDHNGNNYNSRPTATNSLPHLWNMGYDAGEYLNSTVGPAYNSLKTSDVFVVRNHGNEGLITFKYENGQYSTLYANNSSGTSVSSYAANALSDTELVIYCGCKTANTSATYGNLISMTLSKGAKCAIGWLDSTYTSEANRWCELFFKYCSQGNSIKTALSLTDDAMYDEGWTNWDYLSGWDYGTSDVTQVIG